ncbi:fluoroquinolone transport system permease protein [Sedimentibacter acidaminivorans]|uniref:Fluoroquinolone transport system permease protein n=1 Tax=Sedimentibacter acidaminivorans TaxID=913099 RepID=A0ABS4GFZ2_9FIRM|nr:ABC transporter permease [Sedimentibacter acidaminivorans]MBP1926615.1 fluoroquinolone transport system permease protein [Sedimentibacter acidaminivorans]
MRINNLILGDIKFQIKYGFYFVYMILTVFYVSLVFVLPQSWREKAVAIMIFSDPAAMGLFFMGAIVLLEKSERVLNSIAVSPVKVQEYIFSKVISLALISSIVGVIIALSANETNLLTLVFGTILGSIFFTLLGLVVASNISSLNQFFVATIPIEIICFLPPLWYLFGYDKTFMLIHPGCIIIRFISGNSQYMLILVIILSAWIVLLYLITQKYIKKMFQSVGGIKL